MKNKILKKTMAISIMVMMVFSFSFMTAFADIETGDKQPTQEAAQQDVDKMTQTHKDNNDTIVNYGINSGKDSEEKSETKLVNDEYTNEADTNAAADKVKSKEEGQAIVQKNEKEWSEKTLEEKKYGNIYGTIEERDAAKQEIILVNDDTNKQTIRQIVDTKEHHDGETKIVPINEFKDQIYTEEDVEKIIAKYPNAIITKTDITKEQYEIIDVPEQETTNAQLNIQIKRSNGRNITIKLPDDTVILTKEMLENYGLEDAVLVYSKEGNGQIKDFIGTMYEPGGNLPLGNSQKGTIHFNIAEKVYSLSGTAEEIVKPAYDTYGFIAYIDKQIRDATTYDVIGSYVEKFIVETPWYQGWLEWTAAIKPEPIPTTDPDNPVVSPTNGGDSDSTVNKTSGIVKTGDADACWAPLNLILALATCVISLMLIISMLMRKDDEEIEGTKALFESSWFERILSGVVGVFALLVFLITENMNLPMVWTDRWTFMMIVIFALQILVAAFAKNKDKAVKEE